MNIVVVGTLDQDCAQKLHFCGNGADCVTFVEDLDEFAGAGLGNDQIDLLIAGGSIDASRLRGELSQGGFDMPVLATCCEERLIGKASTVPVQPANSTSLSMVGSAGLCVGQKLADMERGLILETLTHCGGNRTWAADILGISIRTLRNKLQQYSGQGLPVVPPGERHRRAPLAH